MIGSKPNPDHWLYVVSVIRPPMELYFGDSKLLRQLPIYRLTSLQRLVSLNMTGTFSSTPNLANVVRLFVIPLDVTIQGMSTKSGHTRVWSFLNESEELRFTSWNNEVLGMTSYIIPKTWVFTK